LMEERAGAASEAAGKVDVALASADAIWSFWF